MTRSWEIETDRHRVRLMRNGGVWRVAVRRPRAASEVSGPCATSERALDQLGQWMNLPEALAARATLRQMMNEQADEETTT